MVDFIGAVRKAGYIYESGASLWGYFPNGDETGLSFQSNNDFLQPLFVPQQVTINAFEYIYPVSTSTGQLELALYDRNGNLVVSASETVAVPPSTPYVQTVACTTTTLQRGLYFVGFNQNHSPPGGSGFIGRTAISKTSPAPIYQYQQFQILLALGSFSYSDFPEGPATTNSGMWGYFCARTTARTNAVFPATVDLSTYSFTNSVFNIGLKVA